LNCNETKKRNAADSCFRHGDAFDWERCNDDHIDRAREMEDEP
jgi:hypothetical protein